MFALLLPVLQECTCDGGFGPCECCLYNPYMDRNEILKNRELMKKAKNNYKKYQKLQAKERGEQMTLKRAFQIHTRLMQKMLSKIFH
jgi:hypothetical protein